MPAAADPTLAPDDDPHGWLEAVEAPEALAWVGERQRRCEAALRAWPAFDATEAALREVLDDPARIPGVTRRGEHLYNFWQDAAHPRGLWRRCPIETYAQAEPPWDVLLDLDALGRAEGIGWTLGGIDACPQRPDRCLVALSRGGADAVEVREFDLAARRFVAPAEGGFFVPEAKTDTDWLDPDTLLIGTELGPGSLTDSGYPRQVRRWHRGTPLAQAPVVFEGEPGDVSAWASVDPTPGFERVLYGRSTGFFETAMFRVGDDGSLQAIDKPADATLVPWRERVLMELRSDHPAGFPAGSLLAARWDDLLTGHAAWMPIFEPTATRSLNGWTTTASAVVLQVLDRVVGRIVECRPRADGRWTAHERGDGGLDSLSVSGWHDPLVADDPLAEAYAVLRTGALTPSTLHLHRVGAPEGAVLKALPARFDPAGLRAEQRFATSADGTRVPYFVVGPDDTAAREPRPTLLYGYGGFEIALTPSYSATVGRAWLARGGRHVVANIRGGGEFGPRWHQAALRHRRQRAFDDFIAVAEDLIAQGFTTPARLGIQGGSNGGLLVGAVMMQRPELFGAVVCQVPLLDMLRFHRLLAGASWIDEYGDPDAPEDRAVLQAYGPYQVLQRRAADAARGGPPLALPPVLLQTSTRDDRVHPGHARKMAAALEAAGQPVLYWENTEGGHGGAADSAQRARMIALAMAFLWMRLGA